MYPSGTIFLSILIEEKGWKPAITVKQILLAVQDLLTNPNPNDPAQREAVEAYVNDRTLYDRTVRAQAASRAPDTDDA